MILSQHASRRMSQRGISPDLLALAMRYATRIHTAGALVLFVRKRDIPETVPAQIKDRLEGLTIIAEPESHVIITSYRNRKALRTIRKKRKYRSQIRYHHYSEA